MQLGGSGDNGGGFACGSLLARLGAGRLATVHLLRRREDGVVVALKCPNDCSSDSKNKIEREFFLLRHVCADGVCVFIATALFLRSSAEESAPCYGLTAGLGGSLHRHIARRGGLPLETARVYTSELVAALVHLASLNCVHRDIKANNVVLTERGHILLCDFDQAIVLNSSSTQFHATEKSKAYTLTGVPHAMSPEAVGGIGYDCKADWWALGVLVFEMLKGEPTPFGFRSESFPSQQDRHHIHAVLGVVDGPRIPRSDAWVCKAAEKLGIADDQASDVPNDGDVGGDLEAILKRFAAQKQQRERPLLISAANFVHRLLEVDPQLRLGVQSSSSSGSSCSFRRELAELMAHPWILRSVAEDLEVPAVDFDASLGYADILWTSEEDQEGEAKSMSDDPFAGF